LLVNSFGFVFDLLWSASWKYPECACVGTLAFDRLVPCFTTCHFQDAYKLLFTYMS